MEKEIRFVEGAHTEKGVSYWKVEFADGDRATCWDKGIAEGLICGTKMDLVITTSRDGKYQNIRGINAETLKLTERNPPTERFGEVLNEVHDGVRSVNGQEQKPGPFQTFEVQPVGTYNKDKSIVAQCLVKAVIGNWDGQIDIIEAVELYKKALELLG